MLPQKKNVNDHRQSGEEIEVISKPGKDSFSNRFFMQEIPGRYFDIKGMAQWLIIVVLIALLSIFGRDIQLLLITRIDSMYIAVSVFIVLFGFLFTLWKKRGKYRIQKRTFLATTALLLGGIAAVQLRYLMPAEAVHFLVFSWLGWVSTTVFGPLYAVIAVVSVALGDEVLQHYLPSRFGDIQDVAINLCSGFAGIILKFRC